MVNLFKNNSEACKSHKKRQFDLGGGARFPKKLAQKLLSVALCIAMVLLVVPLSIGRCVFVENTIDINDATVEVKSAHELYCGEKIEFDKAVTLTHNGETLTLGKDYTVSVANFFVGGEQCNNCGEEGPHAILTITGVGDYSEESSVCTPVDLPHVMLLPEDGNLGKAAYGSLVKGKPAVALLRGVSSNATLSANGSTVTQCWDGTGLFLQFVVPDDGNLVFELETASGQQLNSTLAVDNDCCYHYLRAFVQLDGRTQELRLLDLNGALPPSTAFKAQIVDKHEHLDGKYDMEHARYYDLKLVDSDGTQLAMPLSKQVELWFEVPEGWDVDDLEVVLANQFADTEFDERVEEKDGKTWCVITTDHFSPYALIDKISDEEKSALAAPTPKDGGTGESISTPQEGPQNGIKTGDAVTTATFATLGMVLVMALGVMLYLVVRRRNDMR